VSVIFKQIKQLMHCIVHSFIRSFVSSFVCLFVHNYVSLSRFSVGRAPQNIDSIKQKLLSNVFRQLFTAKQEIIAV